MLDYLRIHMSYLTYLLGVHDAKVYNNAIHNALYVQYNE